MTKNTITKTTLALGAGTLLALGLPTAASAHVSITPNAADAGSYSVITFKVPNESATATTTKLEITLPSDTPFTSVRYVPVAGWSAELVTAKLPEPVTAEDGEITEAVSTVVWAADTGSAIADGQLQQFSLSLGPVPDTGSLILAAEQFYSDGTIVSWSEAGEDAEHPAPVLYVNDEAPTDHHAGGTDEHGEEEEAGHEEEGEHGSDSAAGTANSSATDDVLARTLGAGGLVLGAAGVVFGIGARRNARTSAPRGPAAR